jgi:hypothetical protein
MKTFILMILTLGTSLSLCAAAPATASAKAETVAHTDHDHEGHLKKGSPAHQDHDEDDHEGHPKKDASAHRGHDEEGHDEKPSPGGHKEDDEGHGEHGDEEPWADRVGPGKAVEAFEESGRLQLAEKAVLRLSIQAQAFGSGLIQLPRSAVQRSEGKAFVYVAQKDRWFARRAVALQGRSKDTLSVGVKLAPGEKIVVNGSASLRAAELDLLAGETAGHGH